MRFSGYRSLGRLAMAGGRPSEESHALKVLEGDREGSPGLCLIKLLQSSCVSLGGSLVLFVFGGRSINRSCSDVCTVVARKYAHTSKQGEVLSVCSTCTFICQACACGLT